MTSRVGTTEKPQPVRETLHRQSHWTSLALLGIYSIFLLASTSYIAMHRHLWFDEVQAFLIGALPNFHRIWQNLLRGTDGTPFGFYVFVHLSEVLFGSSSLAVRLPAVIPFWFTTLVLYYAVARRTSPLYGFIAALGPPFTVAFQYSFEARPYALVMLFSALSFVAWQFAKQYKMRLLSVPAITLALAAAISVHYNAILLTVPLLVGEAAYTLRRRKVDVWVLIAICTSFFPILLLLPHIHAISVYTKSSWMQSNFATLSDIYFTLFTKFFIVAILGCVGFALWAALLRRRIQEIEVELDTIPPHEIAAASGYLLLPIALFVLSFYTKAIHYRYAIATAVGISIFVPYVLWIFRASLSRVSALLCLLMGLSLIYTATSRMRTPDEDTWGTFASYSELFNPATKEIYESNEALILGDGPFLLVAKYGNAELRNKSIYVMDKQHWKDMLPYMFRGMRDAIPGPFQLEMFSRFKKMHRSFMMYDPDFWMLDQLVAEGDDVRVSADLPHYPLYEITLKR